MEAEVAKRIEARRVTLAASGDSMVYASHKHSTHTLADSGVIGAFIEDTFYKDVFQRRNAWATRTCSAFCGEYILQRTVLVLTLDV